MKCLYPTCKNESYQRGLCKHHLVHAKKLVKNKLTSWSILVSNGRATNQVVSRGPVTEWFLSTNKEERAVHVDPDPAPTLQGNDEP